MTTTTSTTSTTSTGSAGTATRTVTRTLQRLVLPLDRDLDVMPLYVDTEHASSGSEGVDFGVSRAAAEVGRAVARQGVITGRTLHPDQIEGRHSVRVTTGERLSFGTYFNAFPASYWRRWTIVQQVTLEVTLAGRGATVIVYKSMANGRTQRVEAATTGTGAPETFTFALSLKPFADGGWYWFDVVAGDEDVLVESAQWAAAVPEDRAEAGTVTLAITTMNRPDFCSKLLQQLGEDEELHPYLDEVLVMEQGTQKVTDSEDFPAAQKSLDGILRVIEQANLGGSGGYARGQLETLRKGTATYMMCMDDDVVCEPEGIIRSVVFADLARRPTIVGGHMFSLYAKTRLHSFGEVVQPWRFWWQSAPTVENDWDFASRNLRTAKWLHRRVDVDFNGWFMCLIPTQTLRDVGLSLPVFIKWDDAEYGLRARDAGYPTVTLPGAAVWHVPWTDKNDALDWQAYFHQRNRFISALLHSQYERGGRMVRESFNHNVKHLVSMQYSTVELRLKALDDVLRGPDVLHEDLPTKLPEVRAAVKAFDDARLESDPDAFPPVRRKKPPRKGKEGSAGSTGRVGLLLKAGLAPVRHLRPARELAQRHPEAQVAAMDAQWFRLSAYDSAVVSMPDGTSAAFYHRDPALYRELLRRTVVAHERLYREWPRLAELYRSRLGEVTSPEAWARTFEATSGGGS